MSTLDDPAGKLAHILTVFKNLADVNSMRDIYRKIDERFEIACPLLTLEVGNRTPTAVGRISGHVAQRGRKRPARWRAAQIVF